MAPADRQRISSVIDFRFEPSAVRRALGDYRLPADAPEGRYEVEITPSEARPFPRGAIISTT